MNDGEMCFEMKTWYLNIIQREEKSGLKTVHSIYKKAM